MGLLYRQKKSLYLLIIILGDLILYKNNIIYFKTGPVKIDIKKRTIVILFNILLLGKNKTVLKMPFLQEFNLKIDWIIKKLKLKTPENGNNNSKPS